MKINKVTCIGAGLIGQGWTTLFTWKGFEVTLQSRKKKTIDYAMSQIRRNLEFLVESRLLGRNSCKECLERIKTTTDLVRAVNEADFVQESVYESYEVKKEVFKLMDATVPPNTILASSSSTLNMTVIQKTTNKPGRCIVAHPWNPPHLMPLVEIIPGKETSKETIKTTKEFMNRLGKVPVVQKKEVVGTIGNRLAAALWREAIDLVDKGVAELEYIDKAVSAGPGIRWAILGPHLSYHLGGGKKGIEHYLRHLGPAMSARWSKLATWTSIPPPAEKKIIQGIKQMKLTKKMSVEEISELRDKTLAELLRILYGESKRRFY